jgi:hypothetical protein
VLFRWLYDQNVTHEIIKYTFNGNKVSGPTSMYFEGRAAAQRGCK